MTVVHIHIGESLPDYFWKTVRQTRRFSSGEIILVIPGAFCSAPEVEELRCRAIPCEMFETLPKIRSLKKVSFLRKYGSGDFWHVTMQRLFVLEEVMIREQLEDVIHLENDVTIYFNPVDFQDRFRILYKDSVAVVPLGPSEGCTAALLYAHGVQAIGKITTRMLDLLEYGESEIIKMLPHSKMVHEMMLLGIIHKELPKTLCTLPILPKVFTRLPIEPYHAKPMFRIFARIVNLVFPRTYKMPKSFVANANYDELKLVFDPATYGQSLGGFPEPHKRAGVPVILKNHWIAPSLTSGEYHLIWKLDEFARRCPFLQARNGEIFKLANLHVHNKKIEEFI